MPKITEPDTCVSWYRTTEIHGDFYPFSVSTFSVPPEILSISERSKNRSYFVAVAATAHRRGLISKLNDAIELIFDATSMVPGWP